MWLRYLDFVHTRCCHPTSTMRCCSVPQHFYPRTPSSRCLFALSLALISSLAKLALHAAHTAVHRAVSQHPRGSGRQPQPVGGARATVCSMKQTASGGGDRAADNKNRPRERAPPRSGRSVSNSNPNPAGAKPPRRPPSTSPTVSPRAASRPAERDRSIDSDARPGPPALADMHVLVPVKDVVAVPLADISQAAADSLGGGEATRVSMERFCKTLESVFRTDFSVKVDRANAGLVLGGRRYGNAASRSSRAAGSGVQTRAGAGAPVAKSEIVAPAVTAVSTAERASAGAGSKGKRGKWGMVLRRGKQSKAAGGGGGGGEKEGASPAQTKAARTGKKRKGGGGGAGRKRIGSGVVVGDGSGGGDVDSADEIAVVPLLQLVEELVQNAMFSPIGARDVMMSQVRTRTKTKDSGVFVTRFEETGAI